MPCLLVTRYHAAVRSYRLAPYSCQRIWHSYTKNSEEDCNKNNEEACVTVADEGGEDGNKNDKDGKESNKEDCGG